MNSTLSRRNLIQSTVMAGTAMLAYAQPALPQTHSIATGGNTVGLVQEWDKTFPRSNKVDH